MKLIIFIENIQSGGVDTFCATLINNWPNFDDSFIVVCNRSHPGKENMEALIDRPCKFVYHGIPLSWTFSRRVFFFFPYFIRRVSQPFLRIPFFPLQYLLIRNIFRKNNGDELLVINGGFPGGESCRIANIVWHRMGRAKGVHNFHNFAVTPRFGFEWYENWVDRLLLKNTKLFVSVSKICSDSLKVRKTFRNITNNIYIYNGINDVSAIKNNFNIRKHLNIGNNPLCLMLGTYESRKGHEFVFKSFKLVLQAIPEAHLVVCGGGTEREVAKVDKIRKKIIPTEKIHLFGFIHNGASLINQVDVLLIGSQEFESFGLTAVEAMIRRKPVVSTNTGGLPEVIGTDNSCGYIVGQKDEIEFSEKIILLLRDEKLRKSMGNSGKKRAEELFSACNMSEEYLTAIKKK